MLGRDANLPPWRVVLWSDDPKLRARATSLRAFGWRPIFAPTGYEAAAELLAAGAAALLVDTRAFGAAHKGLLDLAGELAVPVFGVGAPAYSGTADHLAALTCAEIEDVPAILASLGEKTQEDAPEAAECVDDSPRLDEPAKIELNLEPVGKYVPEPATTARAEPNDEQHPKPPPAPEESSPPMHQELGRLLTEDEIASLLEDEL